MSVLHEHRNRRSDALIDEHHEYLVLVAKENCPPAAGRSHGANLNFDNPLTHTASLVIRLHAKIRIAVRIVADRTTVSRVLEQPNVSLDLLLISSRPFHHKPAVSESRRALLQPVVETKIKCRWRQNFQAALALLSQDSIYSSILRSGNSFSFSKTPKSNKLYSGSRAERLVRAFRGFGDFVARRFKALDLCDPMRVCSAQFFNVSLEFEKTRDLRFPRQIYFHARQTAAP